MMRLKASDCRQKVGQTVRAPRPACAFALKPYALSLKPAHQRRGLTLVELLVVIVILLILTAVAIPVLAPNVEQRRVREASRMTSTFLSGARNRAISIGRPVGVQFERLVSNPNASMVMSYVEVPPPYAGESIGSVCRLTMAPTNSTVAVIAKMPAADFNNKLIRVGDIIRFNHHGRMFRITGPDVNSDTIIDDPSGVDHEIGCVAVPFIAGQRPDTVFSWAYFNSMSGAWEGSAPTPVPYQVLRQPIKSSDAPLQLPEGAVIDLSISGTGGSTEFLYDSSIPSQNVVLTFSPDGSIDLMYSGNTTLPSRPTSAIHLHIGRSDGVGAKDADFPDAKVLWNLRDMTNAWVSIGVQTGLVSTTENARVTAAAGAITTYDATYTGAISDARSIARSFQSMGGR